jgi:hypothetical protein
VSSRNQTTAKAPGHRQGIVLNKVVIARLIAKHELTELEASWLLKAWRIGGMPKTQNRFAYYLAGFMAGIALKTVEQQEFDANFVARRRPFLMYHSGFKLKPRG